MNLLNSLERKLYRLRLKPFYQYLIYLMGIVYLFAFFFPASGLWQRLSLSMPAVMKGEVWRLITFLVLPPMTAPLNALLFLYFYYFLGTALEAKWGVRRFFLFYALGALGALAGAVITGAGTNTYLNMSLFFAFALIYPNHEILLFFVLPIKMKWLAALNALYFLFSFITMPLSHKAAILLSLANLFLFFGGDIINMVRQNAYQFRRRRQFRSSFRK